MTDRRARVLVVRKTTSYQTYVNERADPRTQALLARNDPSVARMLGSHSDHEETVEEVASALARLGAAIHSVTTAVISECSTADFDLVVTVGGDGTLLTTSHGVGTETPILGVNSAPSHSVGFFCAARKGSVEQSLRAALGGAMAKTVLSRMQVDLNEESLSRRVLNDALLCHVVPAVTSRYILTVDAGDGRRSEEEQKSSGLWIGPAAGSTAAQRSAGGRVLPLTSRRIQYVVREPYTPTGETLALARGTVDDAGSIQIRSRMRQGRLFLDGPHVVHEIEIGDRVTLRRSPETLTVLGLARAPRVPARRSMRPASR